MSGDTTSSLPEPDELPDLEEREVLFNAYLDGALSEARERQFDRRLDEDREFREAYGEFAEVVDGLRNLPYEFAPDEFSTKVRDRIRIRSRGGFFAENPLRHQRAPYEAIAVVMILIMSSGYLLMGIPEDPKFEPDDHDRLEIPANPSTDDSRPREGEPETE